MGEIFLLTICRYTVFALGTVRKSVDCEKGFRAFTEDPTVNHFW